MIDREKGVNGSQQVERESGQKQKLGRSAAKKKSK